jgi:uncharacterized hydrophobic protein (TIGR00271 family)
VSRLLEAASSRSYRQDARVLLVRVYSPSDMKSKVVGVLRDEPTVSALAVLEGASLRPPGDLILADVPRETANDVVDRLLATGVHRSGSIQLEPVRMWVSQAGFEAEQVAHGAQADAVVWVDVVLRAYEESQLTITFLTFMVFATLIASIGIVLDSQVLLIGAMILGPEFGAVAALGIALVRRRFGLLRQAVRSLVAGFAFAICATTAAVLVGRWLGWVEAEDIGGQRPGTAFIYQPDRWSFVVALIAGAAGVLAMTSAKAGGLTGVFVSVTTIPAAGNAAAALAFGLWSELRGSVLQLVVNLTGMALAGWLTLVLHQIVSPRVGGRQRKQVSSA